MPKKPTILVIDDNPLQREIVQNILAPANYEVVVAEESLEAVMIIAQKEISVIILDIEMPTVNGFQLKKFLIRKKIDIPVIFLSSHSGMGVQLMGDILGAINFLTKPVDPTLLLKEIEKILS